MPLSEDKPIRKSFAELVNSVKFKPESIIYKPDKSLIIRLLRKHSLFVFNLDVFMDYINGLKCENEDEVESYIEEIAYKESTYCKYCDSGCRICLGVDL